VNPLSVEYACLLVPTITETSFPEVIPRHDPESGDATEVHEIPLLVEYSWSELPVMIK
jgi:hypothetical protein